MPNKALAWTEHLPDWASFNPQDGFVEVDPDVVYPLVLKKMEDLHPSFKAISTEITQCGLEAARLVFTRMLKALMYEHGGEFLSLRILKNPKWALVNFPEGEPVNHRLAYIKLGLNRILR